MPWQSHEPHPQVLRKMGLTHAFFSFVHIMSQKGAAEPSEMGTSIINVQMPRALHHEIHVDDLNQV